jgi:hypothetical protein
LNFIRARGILKAGKLILFPSFVKRGEGRFSGIIEFAKSLLPSLYEREEQKT